MENKGIEKGERAIRTGKRVKGQRNKRMEEKNMKRTTKEFLLEKKKILKSNVM